MALFHSRLFWIQTALRAVSVVLLLVCMGFLIHSSVVLNWYVGMIVGYVAGIVLLVFHTALLKRVCRRILGKITVPGRAEAGWTFALDIVAVIAAILAAVYLMMSVSAKRYRCDRRGGCDTVNIYPNHPSWDTVVYLFYAIGGISLLLTGVDLLQYLLTRRATPYTTKTADGPPAPHDPSIRLEEPSRNAQAGGSSQLPT